MSQHVRLSGEGRRCTSALLMLLALAGAVRPSSAGEGGFDLRSAIAEAAAGEVIKVPPGVHRGPLLIDRPLTIEGAPEAVIDGGGSGDVVKITAADVTIRGLRLRNTGASLDRENAGITILAPRALIEDNVLEDVLFGIYCKAAEDTVIRGNVIGGKDLEVQRRGDGIRLWQSHGTIIENNEVRESRDAVIWFSERVELRNNRIFSGRYGLHFMYSHDNVVEGNRLEGNSVGAFLMYSHDLVLRGNVFVGNRGPSGYGVGLKDMDRTVLEDNLFANNRVGLHLDQSPSSMLVHDTIRRNVFAYNDVGVAFLPSVKRNRFVDNTFHENIEQVAILGGGDFNGNLFSLEGRGNYWSDYRGYDLDDDGIGDLPYRSESLFENLIDREPKLRLFLYSPAQQAIEMAARTLPVVRPQPKFMDEAPLMAPVKAKVDVQRERSPRSMLALAAALVAISGMTVMLGGRSFARGRVTQSRGLSSDEEVQE